METAGELSWRKSSYSTSNGGDCVEVAITSHTIAVRDSKDPRESALRFTRDSWQAFTHRTSRRTLPPAEPRGPAAD
jgi:Domain of unknown function (DUF397)